MEEKLREQSISLVGRERIAITGVSDVDSFDEHTVVRYTSHGILTLKGADLHINKLNVETGEISIQGEIDSVAYSEEHSAKKTAGSLLSRLFQ